MRRERTQARARLVEIALETVTHPMCPACTDSRVGCEGMEWRPLACAVAVRKRAGFRDPSKGSWCAAGLTAAMEDAGLVVPDPGTPARRGAVALLDFVSKNGQAILNRGSHFETTIDLAHPGDIIAWLQHPPPDPAGWRRGHVAVIVAVDDESITTVGWDEGAAPGRVMMRRLWRDPERTEVNRVVLNRYEKRKVPRSSTVLWRRPGGLYGVARPVAA
jgi:hypothetical protein